MKRISFIPTGAALVLLGCILFGYWDIPLIFTIIILGGWYSKKREFNRSNEYEIRLQNRIKNRTNP